ncbi:heavy-metal-associated domain-containing protein [Clostridium sp. AM58-1XD]|uniref:heavy-metal-associated domain-containing protein n=1 Tax=Clostridium sp. AM58-1XD TaxID=2292307 RepID=UPI000E48A7EC|nr:heavy-metal-associated domain-containing protein [Clostridium sp. AM58-1XD]RGZ01587.1 copper chaperone [Clostridium sp. AM58-1XD]
MSTVLIIMILFVMIIFSVRRSIARLSSGCSGASGQPYIPRVRVTDRKPSHYPYHKLLKVEGMFCGNSAVCVENALNSISGAWARANLWKEEVTLYIKQDMDDAIFRLAVRDAGYIVRSIQETR